MPPIAIIAAMEREVAPLVEDWSKRHHVTAARMYDVFVHERVGASPVTIGGESLPAHALLIAGGIGARAATAAAEAACELAQPEVLISCGFAGALSPGWHAGISLLAAEVVDAATGERFPTAFGMGTLVTSAEVCGLTEKEDLARRFGARAVDMEAAAVARVARANGCRFLAVKTISDPLELDLPPLGRYVAPDGSFRTARFALAAAFHPAWWGPMKQLARNAHVASANLAEALWELLALPELTAAAARDANLQMVSSPRR